MSNLLDYARFNRAGIAACRFWAPAVLANRVATTTRNVLSTLSSARTCHTPECESKIVEQCAGDLTPIKQNSV